jgi:hypothetical protein
MFNRTHASFLLALDERDTDVSSSFSMLDIHWREAVDHAPTDDLCEAGCGGGEEEKVGMMYVYSSIDVELDQPYL